MKPKRPLFVLFFLIFLTRLNAADVNNNWKVINKVLPAVVDIDADLLFLMPMPHIETASGTGMFISKDGYVLTNAHLVTNMITGEKSQKVQVGTAVRDYFDATIVGVDMVRDLALLKIKSKPNQTFNFVIFPDKDGPTLGAAVFKLGFPGTTTSENPSLSHGVVTNTRAFLGNNFMPFMSTDALINKGDSGGPLFYAANGKVVGVDSNLKDGIGYFIPLKVIKKVLPMLYKGDVSTGWLGFWPDDCLSVKDLNRDDKLKKVATEYLKEKRVKLPESDRGVVLMNAPGLTNTLTLLKLGDVIISVVNLLR